MVLSKLKAVTLRHCISCQRFKIWGIWDLAPFVHWQSSSFVCGQLAGSFLLDAYMSAYSGPTYSMLCEASCFPVPVPVSSHSSFVIYTSTLSPSLSSPKLPFPPFTPYHVFPNRSSYHSSSSLFSFPPAILATSALTPPSTSPCNLL